MADITKCTSSKCEQWRDCRRAQITGSGMQAFADFLDMKDDGKACEFFVEARKSVRREAMKEAVKQMKVRPSLTNLARAS